MKKKTLSKKEISSLNEKVQSTYGLEDFFSKKDLVVLVDDEIIVNNNVPVFFFKDDNLIPTLHLMLKNPFLKKVVVDMGAVKFVVKGADIMRPGIVSFNDNIEKNEIVLIVDETNKKPLSIGRLLFSSEEARSQENGKTIENIHWIGDEIWKTS